MPSESKSGPTRRELTFEEEAQQVLDELWTQKLIPFALRVGKITKGTEEHTIHFYDSRMRTACVPLTPNESYSDAVRSAVLARANELSGPLRQPK
jgi:hypothetical protein